MQQVGLVLGIECDGVNIRRRRHDGFRLLEQQGGTIETGREPDPRCGPISKGGGKTVVAPSTAKRILRARERLMLEFEHGARVVIEASNEFWIEHIRDCFFRQRLFDERECLRAGLAETHRPGTTQRDLVEARAHVTR